MPSILSIFSPSTYIHKQLKAKWANEKWRNIGVISLHHSFSEKKVCWADMNDMNPWFEIEIFVKVNGSIIATTDPKLDSIDIAIAIKINGWYKLFNIFKLILRDI